MIPAARPRAAVPPVPLVVPGAPGNPEATVRTELGALRRPQVLLALAASAALRSKELRAVTAGPAGPARSEEPAAVG